MVSNRSSSRSIEFVRGSEKLEGETSSEFFGGVPAKRDELLQYLPRAILLLGMSIVGCEFNMETCVLMYVPSILHVAHLLLFRDLIRRCNPLSIMAGWLRWN